MNKAIIIVAVLVGLVVLAVAVELFFVKFNGSNVPSPEISRESQQFGQGETKINYVIIGDSTAVGQGAAYENSIAVKTAKHLAVSSQVSMYNYAVSGATTNDVLQKQLPQVTSVKPDIVLVSIGANDVTKNVSKDVVARNYVAIIEALRKQNTNSKIIVTMVPAVDAADRFGPVLKRVIKHKVDAANTLLASTLQQYDVQIAPIAAETRQPFLDDPTLLAADKFHPNERGYALWVEIINRALDTATR